MNDAFLARYGGQDVHRLRGLDRTLTVREKVLFSLALKQLLDKEFTPAGQGQ